MTSKTTNSSPKSPTQKKKSAKATVLSEKKRNTPYFGIGKSCKCRVCGTYFRSMVKSDLCADCHLKEQEEMIKAVEQYELSKGLGV